MPELFEELAYGVSRAEGTPDWDGGASEGRLQNPSFTLANAPEGEIHWLVGGIMRTYTGAVRDYRIVRAWRTDADIAAQQQYPNNVYVRVAVDGVAEPGDSNDVALLWPRC